MSKKTGNPVGRPPTHGSYSGAQLIPITQEKQLMVMELLGGTATAIGPTDAVSVELLARNLAKIELIDRYLQVNGLFTGDGEPQPVLRIYWVAMNAAVRQCNDLGLTPKARLSMGLQVAQAGKSLAELMAQDRETSENVE